MAVLPRAQVLQFVTEQQAFAQPVQLDVGMQQMARASCPVQRSRAERVAQREGQIGQPAGGAIDTDVTTLAASSADGICVQELDTTTANGLTVDATGAITVQRANFDSTLTPVTDASLSDLRTTDAGPIKVVVNTNGLTVNEGTANGSDVGGGVVAATSGDVLLEATLGDVVLRVMLLQPGEATPSPVSRLLPLTVISMLWP